MVKAVPINSAGDVTGEAKNFSDGQWHKMKSHFGKKLAWRMLSESKNVVTSGGIKEVELMPEKEEVSTLNAKSKKKKGEIKNEK